MQSPLLRFDRELVLVPDSVTDWVKCAFADFQQLWRELIKVAVTEIADYFFPAINPSFAVNVVSSRILVPRKTFS